MGIESRNDTNRVYIIDFGLAKKFRSPQTHLHIPYREGQGMIGTARYASINCHLGVEQSCHDDLESLAYLLLYFIHGSLPWQRCKMSRHKQDSVLAIKSATSIESLRYNLPQQFTTFLTYTRTLRFDEKPDYNYLRKIFRDLFTQQGYQLDYIFDWTVKQGGLGSTVGNDKKKTVVSRKKGNSQYQGSDRMYVQYND